MITKIKGFVQEGAGHNVLEFWKTFYVQLPCRRVRWSCVIKVHGPKRFTKATALQECAGNRVVNILEAFLTQLPCRTVLRSCVLETLTTPTSYEAGCLVGVCKQSYPQKRTPSFGNPPDHPYVIPLRGSVHLEGLVKAKLPARCL